MSDVPATEPDATQLHASAVAVDGRGCLITGASAAGKSTLALEMIALGAELVADDRVDVRRRGIGPGAGALMLSAPATIAGMIEARGVGILRLPARAQAPLAVIIDLDEAERERLPEARRRELLGTTCTLVLGRNRIGLAALAVVLLRSGGIETHGGGRGET
jgi:HPr kinase/phosphorylase